MFVTAADSSNSKGLSPTDPSSFSRPDLALVTNLNIDLSVDFKRKIFHGITTLTVCRKLIEATEVILDTHNLKITEIYETHSKKALNYKVSDPVGEFGSKLTIELPPNETDVYVINVSYVTDSKANGLQWLEPEQTAGKKLPFVFTQFQAVHARSVIPCQDTPSVKTPYTASITIPNDMVVVMSAIRESVTNDGDKSVSKFNQLISVPSYLIAFAIGALVSKCIGPRSHVWSEKELIEEAAYEFEDTEKQLSTAENLCGPYVWGIYDLLVLPPSFPFGGMENPCLTFVTPTLLAGDKSLANVVAHEIAHSWTGNLVTNINFEHFWLNEGFTVFVERKIIGQLQNAKEQDFRAICGLSELKETINDLGADNPLTKLVVDLSNVHPDDAFSTVPYEKGHTFLRYLEDKAGGPDNFEVFLKSYFSTYKYKSIDTNEFKTFFETYYINTPSTHDIDWDAWLYQPGMPPIIPNYDYTLSNVCTVLKNKFLEWNEATQNVPLTKEDFSDLSTNQLIQFLQQVLEGEPQLVTKLQALEAICSFDSIKNAEIKFRWLRICLKAHWEEKIPVAINWISEIGRMKYVRPLYRDLYAWEASRNVAIDNFKKQRSKMMHVVAYTVSRDLHLKE